MEGLNMRDSFIFYRSFAEALEKLNQKSRLRCYDAIVAYALNGIEQDLDGIESAIFMLIKPQIDANNKRFENGKRGGRPRNQNETETKPNENQNETEQQPNVNVNVNVNENVKANDNVNGEEKELPPFTLEGIFLETFCEHHRKQFNTEYQPEWRSQTDDVAKITDAIVKKMAESTNNLQPTPNNFRQFTMKLLQCFYKNADDFEHNHWSLHYIATHFNELYIKILNKKNGNTADKDEYIRSIISSMQE